MVSTSRDQHQIARGPRFPSASSSHAKLQRSNQRAQRPHIVHQRQSSTSPRQWTHPASPPAAMALVHSKTASTALTRSGIARSPLRVYNRRTYKGSDGTALNALSKFYGPDRDKVFGPFSDNVVPSHLKGEYPGDYGWDWVGLCADPERFEFLRQAEVMNGRWALLGVLGCLTPEYLAKYQGAKIYGDGVWFKTNAAALTPEGANILGFDLGFGNNLPFLFVSTILILGLTEVWRYNKSGGGFEGPYDPLYPGWDPAGVMSDPDQAAELKVKEVKNARLAMLSFLGFAVQGLVTGKGPLENLADHLADPIHNNAVTNIAGPNASRILGA